MEVKCNESSPSVRFPAYHVCHWQVLKVGVGLSNGKATKSSFAGGFNSRVVRIALMRGQLHGILTISSILENLAQI